MALKRTISDFRALLNKFEPRRILIHIANTISYYKILPQKESDNLVRCLKLLRSLMDV